VYGARIKPGPVSGTYSCARHAADAVSAVSPDAASATALPLSEDGAGWIGRCSTGTLRLRFDREHGGYPLEQRSGWRAANLVHGRPGAAAALRKRSSIDLATCAPRHAEQS